MLAVERYIFSSPIGLDGWVEAFLREHGTNGRRDGARISLVPPFSSSLAGTILHHHLVSVAVSCPAFDIACGPAAAGPGGSVWLPVTEGERECLRLRESLYSGPLSAFRPDAEEMLRLTLARVAPEEAASVAARARERGTTTGRVETLIVQSTDRRGVADIEAEIDLA